MPQVAVEPELVVVSVAVHNHLDTASATVLYWSMVLPQLLNSSGFVVCSLADWSDCKTAGWWDMQLLCCHLGTQTVSGLTSGHKIVLELD